MALAVVAVAIGYTQGFLKPIFAETAVLLAIGLIAVFHGPLLTLLGPRINLPPDLILVFASIGLAFLLNIPLSRVAARFRATRLGPIDGLLGVAFQALTAFVAAYLILATCVDTERAVRPLLASPSRITQAELESFYARSAQDPVLRSLLRPEQAAIDRRLASIGQLSLPMMEEEHPWIRLYLATIRAPLLGSRLAPVVVRDGDRIPWIGRPNLAIP